MRRIGWAVSTAVLAAVAVSVFVAFPAVRDFLRDYRSWWILGVLLAGLTVVLWLLRILLRRPWGTPWRARVLTAADALEYELAALPVGRTKANQDLKRSVDNAVQHHLRIAREAAWPQSDQRLPVGRQFLDWWTGAPCEAAYLNLHEAEIMVAQVLPDEQIEAEIPEALARLETMEVTDPRRRAAEAQLSPGGPRTSRRAAFQTTVKIGLQLKDQQHSRLRSFRNVVLITALGLMLLVLAVCLVGAWQPDALPICFGPAPTSTGGGVPAPVQGPTGVACPSEEAPPTPGTVARRLPAPGDVTLVALLGVLGGGLSSALAIRHLQGSSTPYDVPVALALLKLPSGALSALIGLLFIRGGFVPGLSQLDSQPQILAYAFLFGIAQQLVTRLVDRQAQDILAKVPSKEPVTPKPEPSPQGPEPGAPSRPVQRILGRLGG